MTSTCGVQFFFVHNFTATEDVAIKTMLLGKIAADCTGKIMWPTKNGSSAQYLKYCSTDNVFTCENNIYFILTPILLQAQLFSTYMIFWCFDSKTLNQSLFFSNQFEWKIKVLLVKWEKYIKHFRYTRDSLDWNFPSFGVFKVLILSFPTYFMLSLFPVLLYDSSLSDKLPNILISSHGLQTLVTTLLVYVYKQVSTSYHFSKLKIADIV